MENRKLCWNFTLLLGINDVSRQKVIKGWQKCIINTLHQFSIPNSPFLATDSYCSSHHQHCHHLDNVSEKISCLMFEYHCHKFRSEGLRRYPQIRALWFIRNREILIFASCGIEIRSQEWQLFFLTILKRFILFAL